MVGAEAVLRTWKHNGFTKRPPFENEITTVRHEGIEWAGKLSRCVMNPIEENVRFSLPTLPAEIIEDDSDPWGALRIIVFRFQPVFARPL